MGYFAADFNGALLGLPGPRTQVARITRKVKAGSVRAKFTGRIRKKAFKPGRYRATVTVTDAAGNRSVARTAAFTVVSR